MGRPAAKKTEQPPGPQMTEQERRELDERLAKMFTKPHKSALGGGRFFLLWTARDDSGAPQVMVWTPETDEEIRGANFFHDAAHGLGAFTKPVQKGKPVRRSTEHTALINGILADRADDTGYLVYADYLTEHGDTQGDFIRLCVELAKLPPDSAEAHEKNRRVNELCSAHAEQWFAPLGELGLRPEFYGQFTPWLWLSSERGVVEQVTIDRPGILPENANRLFAAAPFLRRLGYEKEHFNPFALAKVKQLSQIEELELAHTDTPSSGLDALLKSKYLTGLKSLNIAGNTIDDTGASLLAAWPGLAKLEALDISGCGIGEDGFRRLSATDKIANLKRLDTGSQAPDHIGLLLASPHLKNLTDLTLGNTAPDLALVGALRASVFAKRLERLALNSVQFAFGALAELALCPLPALRALRLDMVRLDRDDAGLVAGAAWRNTLTELYLDVCQLGPQGTEEFVSGKFPKLATLDISRNRLANRGGIALANAANHFPALTNLRLWDNNLGAEAVTRLAGSKLLANLTDLDLSSNRITPAGAVALAKSKHLTKLTTLVLDEKTVGKAGKQALLDRFGEGVMSFR
jgi:uncharacterized protein (TIGR02996 family)